MIENVLLTGTYCIYAAVWFLNLLTVHCVHGHQKTSALNTVKMCFSRGLVILLGRHSALISSNLQRRCLSSRNLSLHSCANNILFRERQFQLSRNCSQNVPKSEEGSLSKKDQLKRAVKEYGSTVIVFHVAISLASLGLFYLIVSSGIDVVSLVEKLPLIGEQLKGNATLAGASTFVLAYAVHKVFAPVRISITLTATPFIVRYLRQRGILSIKKT